MSFSLVIISAFITALTFLLEPATSETIRFIVEPEVGTIQLNQMLNVTFQCRINSTGHSYKPMWTLHYPDTADRYLSTHDDNDKAIIEEHGIHFYSGETVANITIPGTVENNRTQIWCTILDGGVTEFSDEIEIIIAGDPLPPNPNLKLVSPSQLEIHWDIPFSHEIDPIQHYNIQIWNTNSGHKFDSSVTQNRYIYTTEYGTQCDILWFNVTAVSARGQSAPGKVSGGFPIAPQSFPSQINVAVTFYGNGTPIAEVSFEAPFICDYQTSNLTITIKDITASTVMPALVHQSTYTGRDRIITETFDTGLLANHAYTLTVTVRDSAFAEYVSTAAVNFSTTFHFALSCTQGELSDLQQRDVVLLAGGVCAVFLVAITTIVIVTVIVRSRRKLKKAPGSTMDLMLNSINRSRAGSRINSSQYDTPYKSSSSLYETIDGYQKHTPAHKATTQVWQQQQYQWKSQQCNRDSKRSGDAIETDTLYQEMHSASASEQGLVNGCNCNHVTKPQNMAASHNHPLKLHACRIELHAAPTAAVGSSDPFCMNDSDATTNLSQSESFGDHLSTMAVVNESVGTTNGEGDQSEYTYMSQAGTLAGQQSKLTLCTNGCISADNPDRDSSA